MNSDRDLDVVELWSGVESIVCVARVARAAGHQGRQHIQAEVFDKHWPFGILACLVRKDKDANISLVEGFAACTPTDLPVASRCLLWMAPTCSSFGFANSNRCKRKYGQEQGDSSYK